MKIPPWSGIVVGCIMVVQWGYFLFTGAVPELQTAPQEMTFHLAAEFITAFSLVISGMAILQKRSWGQTGFLIAIGMLVYSVMNSLSYFPQNHQWAIISIFAVLLAMTLVVIKNVIEWQKTKS